MRAILLLLVGLTACLTMAAGCSSTRWAWQSPIVAAPKPTTETSKETDTKTSESLAKTDTGSKTEPQTSDKTAGTTKTPPETPFKSSRDGESKSVAGTAPEKLAIAGGPNDAGSFGNPPPSKDGEASSSSTVASAGSLTPEVLQLINTELKDATAAERQEWYEQLKKVDPSLIPDILRVRRMSLQATAPTQVAAATPSAAFPPTMNGPGPRPQPMMEAPANPWSQPAAAPLITQAGYQGALPESGIQTAGYTRGMGESEAIEYAVHRMDPANPANSQAIVLQNHELPPTAGTTLSSAAGDPQRLPAQSAQPAGVIWPTPRVEPPATNNNTFGNVPFASGLVQNVVNLVPGRGTQNVGANMPAAVPATMTSALPPAGDWHVSLEQTIGLLEQQLATLPPATTPEAKQELLKLHTSLRMLYLIGNHQERALTAIPGIEPAEQEFWQQLFWGTINALDAEHIPLAKDRATQTMAQLNSAIRRLQEQADLQVRHVTFCQQIVGFGNYEKLARSEFSPGQEVLMYADIDNFKSDPTADGQYRTLLRSTIELMSPSGEVRKRIDFPATEDACSTYRRDYFHNYQFRIPERMPLGPHVLKLTVFDELSGKMNSYSLNFVVK
ncbi:hypothetical protein GC163_11505 [bacterium]|nr:hypothetical protein [bacterium]